MPAHRRLYQGARGASPPLARGARLAMKIVLDITRLVAEGKLTPAEAERLKALAARDTGTLAINALLALGVVAVVTGILALRPSFATGAAIGAALVAAGLALSSRLAAQWGLLGTANVLIGALLMAGGLIGELEGRFIAFALATALLLALAIVARNGLLMALVPVALAGALGSSTGYAHAAYSLVIREATVTLAVFGALAAGAYLIARRLAPPFESLALIFARISLILVNLGFWIGSLWGDYPGETWFMHQQAPYGTRAFWQARETWRAMAPHVPSEVFALGWAAIIVGVGAWAARANRRWVVNTAATFGAIHFYTQWFERLGRDPWSIIAAGLTVVAVAVALWRYNSAARAPA